MFATTVRLFPFVTAAMICVTPVVAQSVAPPVPTAKPPSAIASGAATVSVEGKSTTREGDVTTSADTVVQGSSNVRINGKPVARAGDKTNCGGIIIGGSSTVFVNGKPLATSGSTVTGCTK